MSVPLSSITSRPKYVELEYRWKVENIKEVVEMARRRKPLNTLPSGNASCVHGQRIYSPPFGNSETGLWRVSVAYLYTSDIPEFKITLNRIDGTKSTMGHSTVKFGKDESCTKSRSFGAEDPWFTECQWTYDPGSALSIHCVIKIYREIIDLAVGADGLPLKCDNVKILLRPSHDGEVHIDHAPHTKAAGVPCPKHILMDKSPVVRSLLKGAMAEEEWIIGVPNTNLLTLTHLVEYIRTDKCSVLERQPTHVTDGSDKSCVEVDSELINLLSAAQRLEFKGLAEACVAVMQESLPKHHDPI